MYAIDKSILSTLTAVGIKTYYSKAWFNKNTVVY